MQVTSTTSEVRCCEYLSTVILDESTHVKKFEPLTFHIAFFELGSIKRKQLARWLYLSQMKNDKYCLSKKIGLCILQQAIIRDQWRQLELMEFNGWLSSL